MLLDLPSESDASAIAQVVAKNLAGQDCIAQEDGSKLRLVRLRGQIGDVQVGGGIVAFSLETRIERLLTPRVEISKAFIVHLAIASTGFDKTVLVNATRLRTCTIAALHFLVFPLGCTCGRTRSRGSSHSLCFANRVLEETSKLDTGRNRVSARKGGIYPSKTNFITQTVKATDTSLGIAVVVELGKAESAIRSQCCLPLILCET